MIYDVTQTRRPIISPSLLPQHRLSEWQVALAGTKRTFGPAQSLVTIGSAEWCDLRLKGLPPVGGVLYNCGSKVLFGDLSRPASVPATSFRSSCKLPLADHELDVKFTAKGADEPVPSWPEIEFSWKDWSERRLVTVPMAVIGSDYPSRYRLRGSTLDACHAALIWHGGVLNWIDLSAASQLDTNQRVQQVPIGYVKLCHDVGVCFCGISEVDSENENRAPHVVDDSVKKTVNRRAVDQMNARILQQITERSKSSRKSNGVLLGVLMLPILVAAGMLGYRLLKLMLPHL